MTLTVVTWKWRQPGHRAVYSAEHVNVFARSFSRNYRKPHRIICITDDPTGITECVTYPLWPDLAEMQNPSGRHLPSCYRRLKLFDATTQAALGIAPQTMVLSMDLDLVFCDDLHTLFGRREDFVGWKRIWAAGHRGPRQPPSYNGSLILHRAGTMTTLWTEFDPARSPRIANVAGFFGSDQAWISYRLQGSAPGWSKIDGVYSYSSDVRRRPYPGNAKIISFNGKSKPWDADVIRQSPWITRYWRR